METLSTLYNLLGIRQKIQDPQLRLLYLSEVWGVRQSIVMECEGISHQSRVSNMIKKAKLQYGATDIKNVAAIQFNADEIKYIQMLPREIINDIQVIAFTNNILGLNVNHPLYSFFSHDVGIRIAALSDLGIRNKHLQYIFNKSQPNITMTVKRKLKRSREIERIARYDKTAPFVIVPQTYKQSFIMAGGQN